MRKILLILIALVLFSCPAYANKQQEAIIRNFVIDTLCKENNDKMLRKVDPLVNSILLRSSQAGLDPFLITAMAYEESKFNPWCTGRIGERGIMQINPCHKHFNNRLLREIDYNIIAGIQVLQGHIKKAGSLRGGLKDYTGGGASSRYNKVWHDLKDKYEGGN